jgi:PAS domain S-box-containing protein
VSYETFAQELAAVRSRGDQFQRRAQQAVEDQALLPEALEELSTALEELRVTEEEVRVQHEQLVEGRQSVEAERDHYRELFELAPVAYLVTDRAGVIREVNRRAASLLGVAQDFLAGRPLAMYVATEDRWRLRDRLGRLGGLDPTGWRLTLAPRHRKPVPVVIWTSAVRGQAGEVTGLRWTLQEPPSAGDPADDQPTRPATDAGSPSLLAELVTSRPTRRPTLTVVPGAAPDWDSLAAALHRVVRTAAPLLRADGAGLMLADADGTLHVVTGSDEAEQAFERAERDLGEGPCIDAFASGEVVWTSDLRDDPRWPRLGPAARTNRIRGVLAAPVRHDGQAVGTCNAYSTAPRGWTGSDVEAIGAYAAMLSQLIGSASDARHQGELAAQLQVALESRVLIEQAKGVLMGRHGLDDQAAFTRLRRQARSSARKLSDVAREVIGDLGR